MGISIDPILNNNISMPLISNQDATIPDIPMSIQNNFGVNNRSALHLSPSINHSNITAANVTTVHEEMSFVQDNPDGTISVVTPQISFLK
jgi:hypothetical protein